LPAYFLISTPGTVVSVFIGEEQEVKMMKRNIGVWRYFFEFMLSGGQVVRC
jgi:hypothetical protein